MAMRKLILTDIDDTLLRTNAVLKKNIDGTYDASEFEDASRFKDAIYNVKYIRFLKERIKQGYILGYLTARGSGKDNTKATTKALNKQLKKFGIKVDNKFAIGVSDPIWDGILTAREQGGALTKDVITKRKIEVMNKFSEVYDVTLYDDKALDINDSRCKVIKF